MSRRRGTRTVVDPSRVGHVRAVGARDTADSSDSDESGVPFIDPSRAGTVRRAEGEQQEGVPFIDQSRVGTVRTAGAADVAPPVYEATAPPAYAPPRYVAPAYAPPQYEAPVTGRPELEATATGRAEPEVPPRPAASRVKQPPVHSCNDWGLAFLGLVVVIVIFAAASSLGAWLFPPPVVYTVVRFEASCLECTPVPDKLTRFVNQAYLPNGASDVTPRQVPTGRTLTIETGGYHSEEYDEPYTERVPAAVQPPPTCVNIESQEPTGLEEYSHSLQKPDGTVKHKYKPLLKTVTKQQCTPQPTVFVDAKRTRRATRRVPNTRQEIEMETRYDYSIMVSQSPACRWEEAVPRDQLGSRTCKFLLLQSDGATIHVHFKDDYLRVAHRIETARAVRVYASKAWFTGTLWFGDMA